MLCTQTAAAIQALALGLLVLANQIQLWEVYGFALLLGLINAFDNPTRQAFVAELVGREHLQNAVALNSSLFNAARVAGPALAGVVISATGIGQAFVLNAVSFIPVIGGVLLMRPREFYATPKPVRGNVMRQLAEGLRYAASTPDVFLILVLVATLGTFGYNFVTILPLLARFVLHAGVLGLGALSSALGLGSLVAALGVASARRASQRTLLVAAAVFAFLLVLVGISTSLPLTVVLLLLIGGVGVTCSAGANSFLQYSTPNELRGRVMSLYFLLFAGTTPLGGFMVGQLSARYGVQPTVVLMGLLCAAGVGWAALLARRQAAASTIWAAVPKEGRSSA